MSHQEEWKIAMDWWKSYESLSIMGTSVTQMIRNLAVAQLESDIDDGQGIGSSDVNHTVFYIHKSWLIYNMYCEDHNIEPNIISFLMDEMSCI